MQKTAKFDSDLQNTLQVPILFHFQVFQITLKCIEENRVIQEKSLSWTVWHFAAWNWQQISRQQTPKKNLEESFTSYLHSLTWEKQGKKIHGLCSSIFTKLENDQKYFNMHFSDTERGLHYRLISEKSFA